MNPAQLTAFESAAGVTAAGLTLAIAGSLAVLMLLWLTWIALAHFKLWQESRVTGYDLLWNVARAAILTLLLGFLIR